eukprot:TRINITY_DN5980_c0_g1_i7.p1 TRINITY_DN5980_c0_g1~~TRINITY_DN5980_c0_g1_i7.p1  ORF type:complete len:225 (+),score=14.87 TRINITY_DN5980_c0_g1_i7:1056-1730(+)
MRVTLEDDTTIEIPDDHPVPVFQGGISWDAVLAADLKPGMMVAQMHVKRAVSKVETIEGTRRRYLAVKIANPFRFFLFVGPTDGDAPPTGELSLCAVGSGGTQLSHHVQTRNTFIHIGEEETGSLRKSASMPGSLPSIPENRATGGAPIQGEANSSNTRSLDVDQTGPKSEGSLYHHLGQCKPCSFHFRHVKGRRGKDGKLAKPCVKGAACLFCHENDHVSNRR